MENQFSSLLVLETLKLNSVLRFEIGVMLGVRWCVGDTWERLRHTCFWWGKVRFPKIYRNKAFKIYYSLFKNTNPKEENLVCGQLENFI